MLLQLKLTLFKELTLSSSKKITNVGSNFLVYFKERFKRLNVYQANHLKPLFCFLYARLHLLSQ